MGLGRPGRIRDSVKVDLPNYFATESPVNGARDAPEAAALSQALHHLVRGDPEKCADILSSRLMALEIQTQPNQD